MQWTIENYCEFPCTLRASNALCVVFYINHCWVNVNKLADMFVMGYITFRLNDSSGFFTKRD